jgi:hypothetical protein
MSTIDSIISDIEEKEIGVTQKRALIVEGDSDVVAFESFLGKYNTDWEDDWVVCPAGKKSNVIRVLKKRPQWIGVVDADEWLPETIAQKQANVSNLWVLPRFCIENTLIVATELWQSLQKYRASHKLNSLSIGCMVNNFSDKLLTRLSMV